MATRVTGLTAKSGARRADKTWHADPDGDFSDSPMEPDPTPGLALVYSRLHPQLPSAIPFAIPTVSIGRAPDSTLCIAEDAVSLHHARFERRADGRTWIVDASCGAGTFVNGRRVTEQALAAHDVVRIGDTLLRFVDRDIYGFGAYRLDGSVIRQARPFHHCVAQPLLTGGYQMDSLTDRISKVARLRLSVLITGEQGSGRQRAARELHRQGGRQAFVSLNCTDHAPEQLETALFAALREAHEGTLLLSEVDRLPLSAQQALLTALQTKSLPATATSSAACIDVLLVSATLRRPKLPVAAGSSRNELWGRLAEVELELPALRQRREDLYPLTQHFLKQLGHAGRSLTLPFLQAMALYSWPDNVRELERAVDHALRKSAGQPLELQHLPMAIQNEPSLP